MLRAKLLLLILGAALLVLPSYSYCQDPDKKLSFNVGLNLARPTFIFFNEESFVKSIPSFQLGLTRDFALSPMVGFKLGINFSRNSFNAGRQVGSIYSVKQLDLSYLGVEVGPAYRIAGKKFAFWCAANLRLSRLVEENYPFSAPPLRSSDFGLNSLIGFELLSLPRRPYLLFNYYTGLTEVAKNSIIANSNQVINDYIRIRSFGMQIGFHF